MSQTCQGLISDDISLPKPTTIGVYDAMTMDGPGVQKICAHARMLAERFWLVAERFVGLKPS